MTSHIHDAKMRKNEDIRAQARIFQAVCAREGLKPVHYNREKRINPPHSSFCKKTANLPSGNITHELNQLILVTISCNFARTSQSRER